MPITERPSVRQPQLLLTSDDMRPHRFTLPAKSYEIFSCKIRTTTRDAQSTGKCIIRWERSVVLYSKRWRLIYELNSYAASSLGSKEIFGSRAERAVLGTSFARSFVQRNRDSFKHLIRRISTGIEARLFAPQWLIMKEIFTDSNSSMFVARAKMIKGR